MDRREAVLAELAKYPFLDVELVEAVDGRKIKLEDFPFIRKCGVNVEGICPTLAVGASTLRINHGINE